MAWRSFTKNQILKLAREVGAGEPESLFGRTDYVVMTQHELERFVNLIEDQLKKVKDAEPSKQPISSIISYPQPVARMRHVDAPSTCYVDWAAGAHGNLQDGDLLYTTPPQVLKEVVAWWNPKKDAVSTDPIHRHNKDYIPLYTTPPVVLREAAVKARDKIASVMSSSLDEIQTLVDEAFEILNTAIQNSKG